jgi:signal transduction histidine kinase/CheY-like chemotaxis protein
VVDLEGKPTRQSIPRDGSGHKKRERVVVSDCVRSNTLGHLVAILATTTAILLRWILDPWLGDYHAFTPLYGAVALTVWFGGYRPAIATVVLGYLATNWLFLEPRRTMSLNSAREWLGLVAYALSCGVIIGFGEALRVARHRAEESHKAARGKQRELEQAAKQRLEAERRRNARLVVTQLLAEAATVNEMVPGVIRAICESLGWDAGVFWTVDLKANVLRCAEFWHRSSVSTQQFEAASRRLVFGPNEGLPGQVWTSRHSCWIPKVTKGPSLLRAEIAAEAGLQGAFACPIGLGAEVFGITEFFSREIREPDADLLEMVTTIGGQIGQFMGRKREEDELRKRSDELLQAQEALKAAHRRKDEFLATLAHELRNPLAPIRNAVELLGQSSDEPAVIAEIQRIMVRQLGHMVRLIDDLMDLSRITSGRLQIRRETVELAAAVQSAAEEVRPLIEASGHELTISMPAESVFLSADSTRLAQIFSNLLNNAAKYTPEGGHIWLSAEHRDGEVAVSVRDTGIGLAAEHRSRIFEMFAQVSPALEHSQGGLGIGLALVRSLLNLLDGTIEARSDGLGLGSEFIVRLPVLEGRMHGPAKGLENGEPSLRDGSKCRILVVDDNSDSANSLAMILRRMGHEIQTAYDGLEAVQTAAAFHPQVVLLDIGLPKMNGYDAARQIRKQPWREKVSIIALTGWAQEKDRQRAFEAGFDHHLTKPIEPAALKRLLTLVAP